MSKKACPESFIKVGAASVVLRHALFDIDKHFKALAEALKACEPEFRPNGIARMEIAPGELLLAEASTAVLKVMCAHDSWRAMLERHGIETPTDAQILDMHKKQNIVSEEGSTLRTAVTRGNLR